MKSIYLDYNATTPIDSAVADEMRPYLDQYFGNPSSVHHYGMEAKKAVEYARKQVADLVGSSPTEIVFTSGGTESNNYAIKGIAFGSETKGKHIITSSIEHPAVFEVCIYLEKQGFDVTFIPVDEYGSVDVSALEKAVRRDTILISVMHANNEVGTIQPLQEISKIAKEHNIIFHTDAAQSVGKVPVNVDDLGVDLLSIAGHKLYGPKGVGALYIREGIKLEKLIHGADHEQNLRAGTENVLEIVGLGKACEIAHNDLEANMKHYKLCSERLHEKLRTSLPSVKLNGHPTKRLPNTLNLSFPKVQANTLVSRLEGVAVSAGAACHSESIDVSAVLEAMKVPLEYSMGTIRFSTGRGNSLEEIETAANQVIELVNQLQTSEEDRSGSNHDSKNEIKLTQYTHGLGCACKIEPEQLKIILSALPYRADKKVLIGTETSDDATVYKLTEELAIVQSLDFFTPIVDNPYDFGAIAAANALSDIYAMGAKPSFGMNIVAFPEKTLPLSVLSDILEGAHDKAAEAGISIVGGHSIEDPEPKFGMVVSGVIHPDRIIRNTGAQAGDALILTKPLGTGIISTAMKRGLASEAAMAECINAMKTLNNTAAEIMLSYKVNACTDVTGFGLLGHLYEMSSSSKCNVDISFESIPFFSDVASLAAGGIIPGGSKNNLNYLENKLDSGKLSRNRQLMLADAQTSGGLLIAVDRGDSAHCLNELQAAGLLSSTIIGSFTESGKGLIRIR